MEQRNTFFQQLCHVFFCAERYSPRFFLKCPRFEKKSPTYFRKSPTFFENSPRFLGNTAEGGENSPSNVVSVAQMMRANDAMDGDECTAMEEE